MLDLMLDVKTTFLTELQPVLTTSVCYRCIEWTTL